MNARRVRILRQAWQVAMGSIHGVPKPHLRRLKKSWLQVRRGEGWTPLLCVRPEAVQTAAGVMGSALMLAKRPGWVRELWGQMVKKERAEKTAKEMGGGR